LNPEKADASLVRLRGWDFLARTGDKKSILSLLDAIGDEHPDHARYSLDAVFKNPLAYQELMDPQSLARIRVIHRFSEKDPEQAIRFSLDSLIQEDPQLRLLALDVLDCNIAYLDQGIEIALKRMLFDPSERVRVKSSRLLILLSNYEPIDLTDSPAIGILEAALDSEDAYCRQMAFGMPASIFYKIKNVKSTIEQLSEEVQSKEEKLRSLQEEVQQLRTSLRSQDKQRKSYEMLLENIEHANGLLREQMDKYSQVLQDKENTLFQERQEKNALLQSLLRERKARASEVEHARSLYEQLVADFQQREDKFRHNVYDFYSKFRDVFKAMIEEKEELLRELYRQTSPDWEE
jgi:predicted  nucleic acid-binding Zn-ribbon protein